MLENSNWTRVEARFDREEFLAKYNKSHGESLGRVVVIIDRNDKRYDEILNEACWKALFKLKNDYKQKNDQDNYQFTYLSMGQFLSKHKFYPQNKKDKKLFHKQIRHKIKFLRTDAVKNDKFVKWALIDEGILLLSYLKQFPNTDKRRQYLSEAYVLFSQAEKLNTTQTVYLFLAEVILDYEYIPLGFTREEAKKLAYGYVRKSEEKSEQSKEEIPSQQHHEKTPRIVTLPTEFARPRYTRELNECPQSPQYTVPLDEVLSDPMEIDGAQDGSLHHSVISSPIDDEIQEDEKEVNALNTLPIESLQKLKQCDTEFLEALENTLCGMGLSLEDDEWDEDISTDEEIRTLIDDHYGEGTDITMFFDDKTTQLSFLSWNAYPEKIYLVKKNNKWYRSIPSYSGELPTLEQLAEIYPKVETSASHKEYDPNVVRRVLFANNVLKLPRKDISEGVELDVRRVSEILVANGIRESSRWVTSELREAMIQVYLELYQDLQTKKVTLRSITKALSDKFEVDKSRIYQVYHSVLVPTDQRNQGEISSTDAEKVIAMYRRGDSLIMKRQR